MPGALCVVGFFKFSVLPLLHNHLNTSWLGCIEVSFHNLQMGPLVLIMPGDLCGVGLIWFFFGGVGLEVSFLTVHLQEPGLNRAGGTLWIGFVQSLHDSVEFSLQ